MKLTSVLHPRLWLGLLLLCSLLFAEPPSEPVVEAGVVAAEASAVDVGTAAGGNQGTDCWNPGEPLIGPDLIMYDLVDVTNYASADGIEAYIFSQGYCNIGSSNVMWVDNTPNHPVANSNMFRLKEGRFEQIGQSWVKYAYTALTENVCGCGCNSQGGSVLGVGCSNVYCCGLSGQQGNLGPKSDINAFTGEFPEPPTNPPYSGSIARRLQVKISDLDPAQNGGGLCFGEVQVVAPDDSAAGNQFNNSAYRQVNITPGSWTASLTGMAHREQPAIRAWQENDPEVTETDVYVPGEGLMILAAKATDLSGGVWHYEYAVQNLNSHRSAGSFSVPINECAMVENIGFHDVDYHSGEPFDGTDWPATFSGGATTWATDSYDVNANANALRWGTLYNFRFDADVAPGSGSVTLGLFRPGTPDSISAPTVVPVGVPVACVDQNSCTDDSCDLSNGCTHIGNSVSCDDVNVCTREDRCNGSGKCIGEPIVVLFGDVAPTGGNGTVDVDDVNCVLGGFIHGPNCTGADIFPCGGDGMIDVDDIVAELYAFVGDYFCPHPCPP